MSESAFLTAEWRWLVMLNFEVDPALLRPLVPIGTELDDWNGQHLVSVVGFRFMNTRLCGWSVPGHQNFDEVNLRFYVRNKTDEGWRRGVVFVREIAPRRAVVWVARWVYNENYVYRPMRSVQVLPMSDAENGRVSYEWRSNGDWHGVQASITGLPQPLRQGSEAEFITEHYWGFVRQRDGSTNEYAVEHRPWNVWPATAMSLTGDLTNVYGRDFAEVLRARPVSGLVAEGSPILVRRGRRISTSLHEPRSTEQTLQTAEV